MTDQDGESASASVNIQCNTVKVKLTKESPKENTVPVGGKATFFAEVFSGDKPFSGPTLYYLWEHNPDALFGDPKNPSYETSGGAQVRNTATFRKVGTIPIWVTVLREIDGRKVTIGESEQIPITVGSPELTIKVTPEKPSVGQEVTLQVTTKPVMGDDIISFWWEIPGYWTGTGDKASFKPKDNKPVKATVHAKTKDGGDEVGTKDVTITPQSYEVTISEPRYLESPPQIWKCDTQLGGAQKCGMVTVKPTEFAVHRDLFMKATIKPAAESPRYRWTVDPSGSCGFPSSGSEIRINCSNTGTYTVTLEMTNADGAKLGKATQSVNVSISQATMEGSKKSQDAFDRLANAKNLVKEGKLDEGIALADEAARTDPKNTEAASLATRWKSERTQAMEHVANIKKLADTEKLDEAERELKAVKNLHPKYQPVADAEKLLAGKKDAQTKKTSQSAVLLEKARKEAHLGKLDEAMTSASEAAKVDPKNTEAAKYIDFIKKEKDAAAAGLEGVKKLMDDAKYQEASNALVPLKNKYAYYPPVQKMATELGEAWRSWDSKVKEAVGAVRMANERREFAKALELAKKAREMKPGPYLSTLAQQEEWAKRWEAEKEQKRRVLKSAEERLKNQDYDGAYKAFQEGFQNANNLWATSDPEPGYYGKLREEAFTKQKRIGELMAALRYAAEQTPVPPVDVLERGLKTAAEAAALQPGNGQIKTYENAITARIQKVKEDATRVTEAKKWRDQGEAQQKQNKITEAIASYRESLKYVPDKTLESHIAVLEGEAKKATDRKQNADRLWQEGSALISQGRPSDGLARLKESLQYGQDAERVRYVQDLEARKTKAQSLRDEGAKLQQQNLLKDAVARYNESLKYWPDSGLKAHIATLETKVSQNQETENRKAQARQLRDAAYALQQQNRVREAIGKYRESLNVWPDPKLEDYVRQLEASLAGPAGTPSSSGQTPVPVSSQAGWSGTWKATGKDREEVIFALTQSGNRLSGTYTVLVSFSSGLKETLNGRLDGTVSGNRASGKWGDGKDSRTLGTFDATMASGSNSFRVTIKDADSTDTYTAVRRAGQAVPAASTGRMYTGSWSNAPRKGGVLFNNGNISGVSNNPTRATVFSLAKPHVITLIENYHWNNGRGTTSAGSIGLRGSDGRTYGPWAVSGHPGQGGVPNAYWRCQPNVALPAGTYTVVDSDPATWSQNSGSQGSGHTRVEGYPAN
ncbi:MAG: hypothetical protein A4E57_04178 [Syntrophorhabdaceae bacterium PtaU1.Bin034]|nr:MAG: hypothetical protein A4E57_04178 [Syntrophorhabdaceae bacterium PtaU1.Bin034]